MTAAPGGEAGGLSPAVMEPDNPVRERGEKKSKAFSLLNSTCH